MYLPAAFWKAVAVVSGYLASNDVQQPLPIPVHDHTNLGLVSPDGVVEAAAASWPVFAPPGAPTEGFKCEYPDMPGYIPCSTPYDRSCWLRHPNGSRFDILTDYETKRPFGVERKYKLTITNDEFNTDGLLSKNMILVNGQYPGPLIQACWGDRITVEVTNELKFNGTAVHWHGIRQLNEMPMDGVPGITQCPIAPGDTFTYSFTTWQYGTTWYHSHYSVQYANGLLGPMTIHGPTSINWDEAKDPMLVNDWFHNSSFAVIYGNATPAYPSILINGRGDITKFDGTNNVSYPPPDRETFPPHELWFEKQIVREEPIYHPKPAKKYLLRILNTSFSTTFTFSIDHHLLSIIAADFVPVNPSFRSHITVGIGQRYTVVVEARPIPYGNYGNGRKLPEDDNFWIRVSAADCFLHSTVAPGAYNTLGVLRYDSNDNHDPISKQWPDLTNSCDDMTGLEPTLPWFVGEPKRNVDSFGVTFPTKAEKKNLTGFPLAGWAIEHLSLGRTPTFNPLQINYSDPTFLSMSDFEHNWPHPYVVVTEDYGADDWVYIALTQQFNKIPARHPMHLHGHDFAIVQISDQELSLSNMDFSAKARNNPMRRDVILLPSRGFILLAFKADNPGSWIFHCHIAFHASEGLALQILERQATANERWFHYKPPRPSHPEIIEASNTCAKWNTWQKNCTNWWPGQVRNESGELWYPSCSNHPDHLHIFMDDSGI